MADPSNARTQTSDIQIKQITNPITSKNWTGKKLDEIVTGTNAGDRNNWLTRQVGWLVRTGADPKNSLHDRTTDQP